MPIKRFKPTSPARRYFETINDGLSKDRPERKLLDTHRSTGGRNHTGRITSRFRGGGHKRRYRIVDWKRSKLGATARSATSSRPTA
jgi:large subunit ribosomal protein L2